MFVLQILFVFSERLRVLRSKEARGRNRKKNGSQDVQVDGFLLILSYLVFSFCLFHTFLVVFFYISDLV